MCLFFFSCYAVKAGSSEGNGTALSFPERRRSRLSAFHRTLCPSPAPARSHFPGSCRPSGRRDRCPRGAGRGIHPARGRPRGGGGVPRRARGEYGALSPKSLGGAGPRDSCSSPGAALPPQQFYKWGEAGKFAAEPLQNPGSRIQSEAHFMTSSCQTPAFICLGHLFFFFFFSFRFVFCCPHHRLTSGSSLVL